MTRIHFIGIGGTGLSAIALVLHERGLEVSGSDQSVSEQTSRLQRAGVHVAIGHDPKHVNGTDIVVRSSAIPDDNSEVRAAIAKGIPVYKRSEFIEHLMTSERCIAVAGTHGKTTTTAMIAWILTNLGLDPSYIIGSVSLNLGTNAHAGKDSIFIIEADEYDRMFLGLKPDIAVITSIEHDHPDCFPTFEIFYQAFLEFANRLEPSGRLIVCGDDPGAGKLLQEPDITPRNVISYGLGERESLISKGLHPVRKDFEAHNLNINNKGGYSFDLITDGIGDHPHISLQVPGIHNVRNATAALAVSRELELPLLDAVEALNLFTGTERRFEQRGEINGVLFINDYAHHPTEISATLTAARTHYPNRRIWALWQPHTYSRTKALLKEFAGCFYAADVIIVTDIYAAREIKPRNGLSGKEVVSAISAEIKSAHPQVLYQAELGQASDYLAKHLQPGDLLIILSAGDADQVIESTKRSLRNPRVPSLITELREIFGKRLRENEPLARYTSARIGGPADFLLEVTSAEELARVVTLLWDLKFPFVILGGGSNVLISDKGVRNAVILNRAKRIKFEVETPTPQVWAESGASFSLIARQAVHHGLSGLEWAAGIPGTLGGAVIGNAGAHGDDMATSLKMAEILHRRKDDDGVPRRENWPVERFQYSYRNSILKGCGGSFVLLTATLKLKAGEQEDIRALLDHFTSYRRRTQPPGASMGSMFKNPPCDYAGRLIESVGLKGKRIGDAEISSQHANFFINRGRAKAEDVHQLIIYAQKKVKDQFGIDLELEIELIGDYSENEATGIVM